MDLISHLPPELHALVFKSLHLHPPDLAISHVLLPYTRICAYRTVILSTTALPHLGSTLLASPHLGLLVESLVVVQPKRKTSVQPVQTEQAKEDEEELVIAAFDRMPNLKRISLIHNDLTAFLSERTMRTIGFGATAELVVESTEPTIPFIALQHLALLPSLRDLHVLTPMRYAVGSPSGIFTQTGSNRSNLKSISLTAEPNSSEFTSFFNHLTSLESLQLKSTTTNCNVAFARLGERRENLKSLSFFSAGHLTSNIDQSLLGFTALQDLTLISGPQYHISSAFFETISLLPLRSLSFEGYGNPRLSDIVDFVRGELRPRSLERVGVDIGFVGEKAEWSCWRTREEACELERVCSAIGVRLEGTIRRALASLA